VGFGVLSDAVVGGTLAGTGGSAFATDLQLTTAWNVNAAYEHFWNPQWRTSLYGGYAAVSYNTNANGNLCRRLAVEMPPVLAVRRSLRRLRHGLEYLVARLTDQWNITKDFYMGFDALYARLNSASMVNAVNSGEIGAVNAASISDVGNWQFRFRVHRDFIPDRGIRSDK
jgi:hypothetical protein